MQILNLKNKINISLFLLSFSIFLYQVCLLRIISVSDYYHFAFLIVSIALLGFGISGSFIYFFIDKFKNPDLIRLIFTLGFSVSVFISYILSDWAKWAGYGSVGMGKIIWGKNVLRVLVGLILFVALWQIYNIMKGLLSGNRKLSSPLKEFTLLRLLQFMLSTLLIAALIWAVTQPYLNITSLMPVVSVWLGYAILIAALVLLASALFPIDGLKKKVKN